MKKFDFSKRHNISAICFVVIMVITFVLCYSFPVVHASSLKLKDRFFINAFYNGDTALSYNGTSGYYNVNSLFFTHSSNPFLNDADNYATTITNLFDTEYNFPESDYILNQGIVIYKTSYDDDIYFTFAPTIYLGFNNDTGQYMSASMVQNSENHIYKYDGSTITSVMSTGYASTYFSFPSFTKLIVATCPIGLNYPWRDNINYLLINGEVGVGEGGIGVTPPYPDESADNNLVMEQADFTFTHQTYYAPYNRHIDTGSAVPVGTITFKGQPNDYQLSHSSDFNVHVYFSFDYDVNYKNTGTETLAFKRTSEILNNSKNLTLQFTEGQTHDYSIPLSNFISNGNQYSLAISDIFDQLHTYGGVSLSQYLRQSKEIDELSYNKFRIYATAYITGGQTTNSGRYTEWYNFNSKKGLTTDESLKTNPNPYTPDPTTQASDDPDTSNVQPTPNVPGPGGSDETSPSTTTTTTTNGGGQIVITNSPTFNNNSSASSNATSNGNGGGMIPTLLSYLSNGQQSSVSTLENVADTNGWLQVVNSTYTFVPSTVWTSLTFYFGIALSILIVGFIISVVIKFIT